MAKEMPGKRKRVSSSQAARTAVRVGNWKSVAAASRARRAGAGYRMVQQIARNVRRRVGNLERMIETKEGCRRVTGVQLSHNNLTVLNDADGNVFNPFISAQAAGDPMAAGGMNRIGDKITVKGLKLKFFVQAALDRSKVYIKFYLVRMAKGDTLDRTTFFKNACANKMIDQVNTERFTIIASKRVSLKSSNTVAANFSSINGVPTSGTPAGLPGSAILSMWIPGRKFGRGGNVQYENNSTSQLKFFDYRLCAVVYDWNVTPQDFNNVGYINDGYCKLYFKDA